MSHSVLRARIAWWLMACAAMIWLTLVVGGITRLTHSGLSIVQWQPLAGVMPPLDGAAWQAEFARYRESPEYRMVNAGMSLEEFKGIFWWEYGHRLLGRLDGLVLALPLLLLWRQRAVDAALARRLAGIFVLGALQGALGWYMVKSGLANDPRVSQYRLAAHLALAFAIFGLLLWTALGQLRPREPVDAAQPGLRRAGMALLALLFVMAMSGALVAGIHAGKAYNTFPLMAGRLVPEGILMLDPWYLNFFNNPATVQFDHRLGAALLAVLVPWFLWRARGAGARARRAAAFVLAALALQISLGIATLLLAVPVALGTAHQAGAMLLFGTLVWLNHELRAAPRPTNETAAPEGAAVV
ncbi:MAG TPA: COX15/CtaA family protein [Rhodocyclaceae bacterium]